MARNRKIDVAAVQVVSNPVGGGNELVLWDPQLASSQRRRAGWCASRHVREVIATVIGAGLVILILFCTAAASWQFALFIAIVFVAVHGAVTVGIEWVNISTGNLRQSARRRKTLPPGELCYRAADFAGLTPLVHNAAAEVIVAVYLLQLSPARCWLGPDVVHDAQQVAWDMLSLVNRSRTARVLVDTARDTAELADLTALADDVITTIDRALVEVLTHLRNTVVLADAWTDKLSQADLRTRITDTLDELGCHQAETVAGTAETLSCDVFTFVTSARDVLDAGSFPWERAIPQQGRCPVVRRVFRAVWPPKARAGKTS